MTDNLRERIAAVLWRQRASNPTTPRSYYLDHADELIRELELKHSCRYCGGWGPEHD